MLSDIMQRNTEIMEEWRVLLYHLKLEGRERSNV